MEIGRTFFARFGASAAVVTCLVMLGYAAQPPAEVPPVEPQGQNPPAANANQDDRTIDISGVWRMHGRVGPNNDVTEVGPATVMLKHIERGRWSVTYYETQTGSVQFHHGGTYKLQGDKYAEKVEFANASTANLINQTIEFVIRLENDSLVQVGTNNGFNEVWKRADVAVR